MALKQRGQNPVEGDTVRLGFCVFNGGDFADPASVSQIAIYKLYATDQTDDNPLGRVLVTTIAASNITRDDVGRYHTDVLLTYPLYTQGRYQDEWTLTLDPDGEPAVSDMDFTIYPNAWFVDAMPIVYDFSFQFKPNRVVMGSKKYIEIMVSPNVPRGTDKQRYYENMIVGGDLYVSIEQKCGDCMPEEQDLRLVVDRQLVTERDGCHGYFFLDTSEDGPGFACGLYDCWFEVNLGPNVFISEKEPLQLYK
jgi:hypothetical protein